MAHWIGQVGVFGGAVAGYIKTQAFDLAGAVIDVVVDRGHRVSPKKMCATPAR
jgi:hypothetical protein